MREDKIGPAPSPSEREDNQSLSNHLLWTLFIRQLLFVTVLNVLLFTLFSGSMLVWAEHCIYQMVMEIQQQGLPTEEDIHWLEVGHITFEYLDREPVGASLHRKIPLPKGTEEGLWDYSEFPLFRVEFPEYAVTVDLSIFAMLFRMAAYVSLTLETIFICSNLFGNNRSIHRSLRPIQNLAATAARLNSSHTFPHYEMDSLAGELEKINATHLDTRIPVSGTEKELQTLAQAINAMLDRVEEAYVAQMRFVSDASHELRTPIAVIQGYSAMLDRWGKSDPETLQESIDAIRSEAKAMELLMEQLLFLARGDHRTQQVTKQDLDLSHLVGEVLREEEMIFPQHEMIPVWDGTKEEATIVADPVLIKQLLRILVDNSLKYTPTTGRVWVSLEREDRYMKMTVQDEGMGIEHGSLPHIFQRFYRSDSSRTRQTGGTGLGLSIAFWIVTQHEGWFEVTSRVDIGTRMTVVLPCGSKATEENG